ncbi:unnamed protein product [Cuscuta epithymum]|uniref:Uncharacterized protein n=1 Tax=Cuscuta epithymum TaxID=186058 RepID=A0AAV0CVJ3_9ASTE|nr:unnamed protein product [Cuscuta epithymum]
MEPPTATSDVDCIEEFVETFSVEDKTLRPGQTLTVWLSCKPKEIGLHTSAVHFNVGDETIERLVFVLAEDKVSQSLVSNWDNIPPPESGYYHWEDIPPHASVNNWNTIPPTDESGYNWKTSQFPPPVTDENERSVDGRKQY